MQANKAKDQLCYPWQKIYLGKQTDILIRGKLDESLPSQYSRFIESPELKVKYTFPNWIKPK